MHQFLSQCLLVFPYYLLPYGAGEGRLELSWLAKPKGTDELSSTQDTYLLSYITDFLSVGVRHISTLCSLPVTAAPRIILSDLFQRSLTDHSTMKKNKKQKTHALTPQPGGRSAGGETNAHWYFRRETHTSGVACVAVLVVMVGTAMRIGQLSWRG